MPVIEMRRAEKTLPGSLGAVRPQKVLPLYSGCRRITDPVIGAGRWLPWALAGKRACDVAGAAVFLLLLAPLFLLLMLMIRLDSPGPAFFWNERIGLHGRLFRICKFRTMRHRALDERDGLMAEAAARFFFKHKTDPRVTRLGYFLRKYSLDELPQFWNVLRGEMSLIGPRPLLKEDFARQHRNDPLFLLWAQKRHDLWPGITGLWQVSGRSELGFEESLRMDLHYVAHWTPRLDAYILLRTLPAILQGRGAY